LKAYIELLNKMNIDLNITNIRYLKKLINLSIVKDFHKKVNNLKLFFFIENHINFALFNCIN